MTGTYFFNHFIIAVRLNFYKNGWGLYALLLSLLLCTVTSSTQRLRYTPIEEFYRYRPFRMKSSIGVSSYLWIKNWNSSGMSCNRRSESPVCPSLGLACSAVVYKFYDSPLSTCTSPPCFPWRAGRILLETFRFFFKSEMYRYILTYVQFTLWCIFLHLFCFKFLGLWKGSLGHLNPKKAYRYHRRIPHLKLLLCTGGVTAKERTGLRHFFL